MSKETSNPKRDLEFHIVPGGTIEVHEVVPKKEGECNYDLRKVASLLGWEELKETVKQMLSIALSDKDIELVRQYYIGLKRVLFAVIWWDSKKNRCCVDPDRTIPEKTAAAR